MKKLSNEQLAFFLARVILGLNFFMHGLVRIPKLQEFASSTTEDFESTYLPEFLVSGFTYALSFIEFSIGLLLIIGLKTRFFLAIAAVLIMLLLFGSGIKEDWSAAGTQMVYALFIYFLIKNLKDNALAIDSKSRKTINGFTTKQ